MKIKEEYLDFFKSDDEEVSYKVKKYNKEKLYDFTLKKVPLKNPNLCAVYYIQKDSQDNPFSKIIQSYLCTFDKNTLDILHMSSDTYDCLDTVLEKSDYREVDKLTGLSHQIKYEINELLLTILKNNTESYLKSIDFKEYENKIIEMYKNKTTEPLPDDMINFKLDFDKISDYFSDKKAFLYKQAKLNLTEENINKFKRYLALTIGYEQYVNRIENSDIGKIKKILLELMNNEKYKTLKINYTYPDGKSATCEYSKKDYGFYSIKSKIFDCEKIEDIPIRAITSIKWGRSTLYQRDEVVSEKFDYPLEQQIDEFMDLNHITHYPDFVYKDKEYIEKLYDKCGPSILEHIDKGILSDSVYMTDFINRHEKNARYILANMKGSSLLSNKLFMQFIFSKLLNEDNQYNLKTSISVILNKIDPILLEDLEIAKELFRKNPSYDTAFFNKFDISIINSPEIMNIISKGSFDKSSPAHLFFKYFDTPEKLLKVFSKEQLQSNICYIDEKLLTSDKALVMTLLDDMEPSKALFKNNNYFIDSYANDEIVMEKIIKIVSGQYDVQRVAALLKLNPECDKEKVYEISLDNIEFINILKNEDKKVYFVGEAYEAKNILEIDGENVEIQSAYGIFGLTVRSYSTSVTFSDFNGHKVSLSSEIQNEVLNIILDNLKEITKDETSDTIYTLIRNNASTLLSISKEQEQEER